LGRRSAPQSVRRRDRLRPSARRDRRPADRTARARPARGQGPLRTDRPLHRHGHGLRDPLGERPVMAETVFKLNAAGRVALVTIDNGEDYRKPTTLGRSAFESAVTVIDELENGSWDAAVFTGKAFVFC